MPDVSRSTAPDADGAYGADGPLDVRGERPDRILLPAAGGADAAGQDADDSHREHEHQDRQSEQHRVDDEHADQGADKGDRATDGVDEPLGEYRVQQGRVRSDPGDEVARTAPVVLTDGQLEHVPDEAFAGREHHRGAGALQQVVLHPADDPVEDEQSDEQPQQGGERGSGLYAPDEVGHDEWLGQRRRGPDDRQADRDAEDAAVRCEVGQQVLEPGARAGTPAGSRERPTPDWFTHAATPRSIRSFTQTPPTLATRANSR